ncbi:hypothetical protein FUSO8_07995 [Fusobacterium necrophorum DJ-2]|uniref:Transposase n=2 Tax=Fusobacterium necrophorum TaxID=859 RepID=A0AB73BYE6_9FUSO|nr:hypothetical protein [Fusobacterium necrophorum]KDE64877.1 hypothetical protein FUSO3_02015 [Fusobacterium necrophorum BL]KDE71428.1 hypothetical protein FUSO8_07995 [Fusobacterium necrophorum DJ-2]
MITMLRKQPKENTKKNKIAKKAGFLVNICLKTLYNYIHQNLFVEITEEEMVYKKKRGTKYRRKSRKYQCAQRTWSY